MRTSVSSHTDYSAFRNINRYGAILAETAPSVFVKHFQKGLPHPDFLVKSLVKSFYPPNPIITTRTISKDSEALYK
jgi:hypothetical protein